MSLPKPPSQELSEVPEEEVQVPIHSKDPAPAEESEESQLYFTKEGRPVLVGRVAPTAYAWSYPWPPCPTNLCKNKVFRPKEEESEKELRKVIEEFKNESKPHPSASHTAILDRSMLPDIELALYWDRHPFEFRPEVQRRQTDTIQRAKSAMNLSQIGELLSSESKSSGGGGGGSRTSRRSSAVSAASSINNSNSIVSDRRSTKDGPLKSPENDNIVDNHETTKNISVNPRMPKILQVLNTTEKTKFSKQRMNNKYNKYDPLEPPKIVRPTIVNPSVGVQVTLDGVMEAAMKSSYLCPLHGSYRKGVERRANSGFRTDMTSVNENPHATCSRGRSRTKMLKCAEIQTDNVDGTNQNRNKNIRSKTAPPITRRRTPPNMISENRANFRHPGHITDAENRKLRNKILSYCFTKHSIF